uniref:Uncharacterized protein n=1 Tax=Cryptomonas curvata TaxID=233186 RepID=A0A7S0N1E6_9CRYP|mmetsp:Transcript_59491/g.124319  ORF Transcript_59491/g.124319 Transcript_59491/m.124319 type:complete len:190 (+) Transcript_59491:1055-1624(+)
MCPSGQTSWSCTCRAGYYGSGQLCTLCPQGSFCNGGSITSCTPCETNAVRKVICDQAGRVNDLVCSCNSGFVFISGAGCTLDTTTVKACGVSGGYCFSPDKCQTCTVSSSKSSQYQSSISIQSKSGFAIIPSGGVASYIAESRVLSFCCSTCDSMYQTMCRASLPMQIDIFMLFIVAFWCVVMTYEHSR